MSSPDEIRGTTQCPVAAKAPPTEPIVPVGGALAATAFSGARTAPDFIRATKRGCRGRTRTSRLKPLLQVFTRPVGAAGRHCASAAISPAMCSNYSPSHSSTRACGRGFSRDSFFWRSNGPGFHPGYETWMPGADQNIAAEAAPTGIHPSRRSGWAALRFSRDKPGHVLELQPLPQLHAGLWEGL